MKRICTALAALALLGGTAFAAQNGASNKAPGQKMQDKGSKPGTTGASGYAPGQSNRGGGMNNSKSK